MFLQTNVRGNTHHTLIRAPHPVKNTVEVRLFVREPWRNRLMQSLESDITKAWLKR